MDKGKGALLGTMVMLLVMMMSCPVWATPTGGTSWGSYSWGDFDVSLNNQQFDWHNYAATGDWLIGTQEFNLDGFPYTNMQNADFSIILAGSGYMKPADVFLNGISLGKASVGDGGMLGQNIYRLDSWPLTSSAIASLGQNNVLTVQAYSGDGWAFVGANIAGFYGDGGGTAPVPEPATMLLFGTGLAALSGTSWWKKKKK